MRCQKHKKYYKEDNTTSVFFPKNDVNVSWLTSVFIKTDVAFFPNSNPKFQFNFRTYSRDLAHSHCPQSHSRGPVSFGGVVVIVVAVTVVHLCHRS